MNEWMNKWIGKQINVYIYRERYITNIDELCIQYPIWGRVKPFKWIQTVVLMGKSWSTRVFGCAWGEARRLPGTAEPLWSNDSNDPHTILGGCKWFLFHFGRYSYSTIYCKWGWVWFIYCKWWQPFGFLQNAKWLSQSPGGQKKLKT